MSPSRHRGEHCPSGPKVRDRMPERDALLAEVLAGLSARQRRLSPKFFYDDTGSRLFEQITRQPEYYLTDCELEILDRHGPDIGEAVGPRAMVVELGSGSSRKLEALLAHLREVAACVPVDISREQLSRSAARIARDHPGLAVLPVCADFMRPFPLPDPCVPGARPLLFFPGSTIGNFDPPDAVHLLDALRRSAGSDGRLLIGFDLRKDPAVIEAAYNDAAGVTAAFNRNILVRINRDFGADFDPDAFAHRAFFDTERGRVEMHLVSLRDQTVHVAGRAFRFKAGESIHTENSYKHTAEGLAGLAERAGWREQARWTDSRRWFCVMLLDAQPASLSVSDGGT